jgi:RsiW-degrading membrane proteinase PrsW (M82 family)
LAALFALVAEQLAYVIAGSSMETEIISQVTPILIVAVIIEEIIKLLMISKTAKDLIGRKQIFFSSLVLGLGFSLIEVILYLYGNGAGLDLFSFSILGVLAVHLVTCAFAGFVWSQNQNVYFSVVRILLVNTTIHLGYNLFILFLV